MQLRIWIFWELRLFISMLSQQTGQCDALVLLCFFITLPPSCGTSIMSRLTITLDDNLHRALKETAARQGRSIASIIEESLRLRGIRDQASARTLVDKARERAGLDAKEALELAVDETRAVRGQ
jgi:predicted transcriptional regulator